MGLIKHLRRRRTYLSTREMELLHVTRNTLCAWVRRGRVTAIRIGNRCVFDPHLLADWLGKRQTMSSQRRSA